MVSGPRPSYGVRMILWPAGWEERERLAVPIPMERIKPVIELGGNMPRWFKAVTLEPDREKMMRFGLAVNIAFLSGAWVHEVASLTVTEVNRAYSKLERMREVEDFEECVGVMTTATDSRSARMLVFHPRLLDACHTYIEGERATVVRHSEPKNVDHDYLLVNHANDRATRGRPVSPATLAREFSEAVIAAGFTTSQPGDGTCTSKILPMYTFDSLRLTITQIVNDSLGKVSAAVFLGASVDLLS
jgi:hypothetical protein